MRILGKPNMINRYVYASLKIDTENSSSLLFSPMRILGKPNIINRYMHH